MPSHSPFYATLFILVYPFMKFVHEFAHGLTLKHLGGEVHELGIALMVLLPIPYIDASSAAILPDKRQRMLIGAAGIVVELGFAAIAAIVWVHSSGLLHDLAMMVLLIGGLSTVLFNANPLLKFDGYYVLADWIEIPNLADRSRKFLLSQARTLIFGLNNNVVTPQDPGEQRWLIVYGVLSIAYRIGLMLSIAFYLTAKFFFFGIALSIWIIAILIAFPLWHYTRFILTQQRATRYRAILVSSALTAVITMLIGVLPMPHSTMSEGVVWLPENAIVRVASQCEVSEVISRSGTEVTAGDTLFYCEDIELDTEEQTLRAALDELTAKRNGLTANERTQRAILKNEIRSVQASLMRVQDNISRQNVIAKSSGRFLANGDTMLEGRYFNQGVVAAYIVSTGARTVRLAIEQSDIGNLQNSTERIEIQFDEQPGAKRSYLSSLLRQTPKADAKVPSAALTTAGGGRLLADPAGDGTTVIESIFDVELSWPADAPTVNVGSHVQVKFVHKSAPFADRLLASVRRAFLGRLDA